MTSINGETGKNGFKLRLDYEVTKQNTADNKSTVHMVLYLYANTTGSYNQDGDAYWSINGKKTYYTFNYTSPAWYVLGERTEEISHNNDGTKTVTLSGEWCSAISGGWAPYSLSVSGEVTLPTIPRATVPSMGAATIGEEVHISLPRASSGFTHTLRYVFGGAAETIDTGVAAGYDWLVPESLATQIPDAASGKGTLTCETYSGSTLIGSKTIAFTASVPGSMKPAITPGWATVTYDNSGTKASGIAAWVQGYSKAKAVFDSSKIACKQGASVRGYSITYLGKTVSESPYRTETIGSTAATVRCTVTDSRGLSDYEDFEIAIHPYAPPALTGAMLYRADGDGAASDSGTHIAGRATANYYPIGGENAATIRGYWKAVGGSYGSGEALSSGVTGIISGSAVISADRSYVAKLVITDSLGNTAEFEDSIPTERVAFHLKEGGNGAAFGKVAETEHALELAEDWELKGGKKAGAGILQTTAATDLNAAAEKIAVLDSYGTVRYRTPAELRADLGYGDYVLEQGTSGIWAYRKWASGVAECWGQPSKSVASSGTFLGANAYSTNFALPSGLFVSVDSANANPRLGSNYAIPAFIKTTPTSVGVDALSNESGTKDFSANIFVRGRWK